MSLELDPILDLIISPLDADVTAEGVPDAVGQLFENARLDSAVGKAGTAVSLRRETQDIDATATKLLRHGAPAAPASLDDAHRLEKRYVAGIHSGKKATRIEKSANGKWIMEFDERGELIRGYVNDEEEAA
jgi:hypothetical protein